MRSTLLVALMIVSAPVFAMDKLNPMVFCKEKKLQTNLCDQLEWGEVKASAENLKNCRARQSSNTGESKCSKGVAEEMKRLKINEGKITRRKFSEADLKDAGFGLPIVAQRLFHVNGQLMETEQLTKPDDLCTYLGFSKAEEAKISNTLHSEGSMRNKSMIVSDHSSFLAVKKKISIDNYDGSEADAHVVKLYNEITCVKVENEQDKEVIKEVETILSYVGEEIGARRLAQRQEREVHDGNRGAKEEEENEVIEHDASISDFLFGPSVSK